MAPPAPASNRALRSSWVITIASGVLVALSLPSFFRYIDARPSVLMKDPFLAGLPARDVSIPLFIVLYGTVCIGVHHLFRERRLLRALQAYVLLLVLRMCTLALVPLGPPPGLVPLQDPLTRWFYPDALPFEKDLFFSGHTATLFLLYLALPRGWRKGSAMLATVVVGLAVLVQHVHWTVDVLAAPVAAALSWWWSGYTARFADLPATRSPGSMLK